MEAVLFVCKKGAKYPRLLSRGYFFTNEEEEIVSF